MGTYHKQATVKFAAAAALAILAVGMAPNANAASVPFTLNTGSVVPDIVDVGSHLNLDDPTAIYQQLASCSSGPGCTGGFTALGQPFEETGYFTILSADSGNPIGLPAGDSLVLAFQGLTGVLSADGSTISFNPSAAGAVGLFIETHHPLANSTNPFADGSQELELFQVIDPSNGTGGFDVFNQLGANGAVAITLLPDTGVNTFTDSSGNPFLNGYIAAIFVTPALTNATAGPAINCPTGLGLTGMCSLLTPNGDDGSLFVDPIPTPEPGSIALLSGGR